MQQRQLISLLIGICMAYEIKLHEWQELPEDAQREVYSYFLFIKQRAENQSLTPNGQSNITLPPYRTSNVECLPDDDPNKIWTLSDKI